jgi:hypothetical protein
MRNPHMVAAHMVAAHMVAAHMVAAHMVAAHMVAAHMVAAHMVAAHMVAAHMVAAHMVAPHMRRVPMHPPHLAPCSIYMAAPVDFAMFRASELFFVPRGTIFQNFQNFHARIMRAKNIFAKVALR